MHDMQQPLTKQAAEVFLNLKLREEGLQEGTVHTKGLAIGSDCTDGGGREERAEEEMGRERHHIRRLYPSTGNTFFISHLFSCHVREGENRHAYFSCSFSWTIWC